MLFCPLHVEIGWNKYKLLGRLWLIKKRKWYLNFIVPFRRLWLFTKLFQTSPIHKLCSYFLIQTLFVIIWFFGLASIAIGQGGGVAPLLTLARSEIEVSSICFISSTNILFRFGYILLLNFSVIVTFWKALLLVILPIASCMLHAWVRVIPRCKSFLVFRFWCCVPFSLNGWNRSCLLGHN